MKLFVEIAFNEKRFVDVKATRTDILDIYKQALAVNRSKEEITDCFKAGLARRFGPGPSNTIVNVLEEVRIKLTIKAKQTNGNAPPTAPTPKLPVAPLYVAPPIAAPPAPSQPIAAPPRKAVLPEPEKHEFDQLIPPGSVDDRLISPVSDRAAEHVILEPTYVDQEHQVLKQSMRNQLRPTATRETNSHEAWKTHLVMSQEMVLRILRKLSSRATMTIEAQQLLIVGIQQHLHTVFERAIMISRKRLLRQVPGKVVRVNKTIPAIVWGPPINEIVRREDEETKVWLRKYHDVTSEVLKDRMIQFDSGRKKGSTESTWWEQDTLHEQQALLSLDALCDVYYKHEIAQTHDLGPYAKKAKKTKVEASPPPPSEPIPAFQEWKVTPEDMRQSLNLGNRCVLVNQNIYKF